MNRNAKENLKLQRKGIYKKLFTGQYFYKFLENKKIKTVGLPTV